MELLLFLLGGGVVVSAAKSDPDLLWRLLRLLCSCSLMSCASLSLSSTTLLVSWLLGAAGEKHDSTVVECWLNVGPGVRHVGGCWWWWIDCRGGGTVAGADSEHLRRTTKSVRESTPPLTTNNRCWLSLPCCWPADHSLPKISSRISIEWCGLATGTAGASIIARSRQTPHQQQQDRFLFLFFAQKHTRHDLFSQNLGFVKLEKKKRGSVLCWLGWELNPSWASRAKKKKRKKGITEDYCLLSYSFISSSPSLLLPNKQ